MDSKVGFEYLNDGQRTPFETFLMYTDEKVNSSKVLSKILKKLFTKDGIKFLDIGAGDGKYLLPAIKQVNPRKRIEFTLLEPSVDLIRKIKIARKFYPRNSKINIINSTLNDFLPGKKFDIILFSHPPIKRDRLSAVLKFILESLNPSGSLILTLRGKDDTYRFRTKFKSRLTGKKNYKSLNIYDAVRIFNKLSKNKLFKISILSSRSKVLIPIQNNIEDTILIVEFYLNKKWKNFPVSIKKEILTYIKRKNGIIRQKDIFLVVKT